jgi:hypothetical protein
MANYNTKSTNWVRSDQKKGSRSGPHLNTQSLAVLINYITHAARGNTPFTRDAHEIYTLRQLLSIMALQQAKSRSGAMYCTIRYSRLAELTTRCRRTMIRHVTHLVHAGYLRTTRRWLPDHGGQRSNLYRPTRYLLGLIRRSQPFDSSKGDTRVTQNQTITGKSNTGGGRERPPPPTRPPDGEKEADPDTTTAARTTWRELVKTLKGGKV